MRIYQVYLIDSDDKAISELANTIQYFFNRAMQLFGQSVFGLTIVGMSKFLTSMLPLQKSPAAVVFMLNMLDIAGWVIILVSIAGILAGCYMLWAAFVYFNKLPKKIRESQV